jgi:hypothetical protein
MNDKVKLDWDNSRYTNLSITEEDLKKYSEKEYDQFEKKMDIMLLHTVAEQRCRPFGCRLQNCLGKFHNLSQCSSLFRQLNICVDIERKKVIYEFVETKKQPNT